MSPITAPYVLFTLAVLGFLFVTYAMQLLTHHFHRAKASHDLIVETKRRRAAYLREVAQRKGLIADDDVFNVDIIDDDEEAEAGEPLASIGPDDEAAAQAA